VQTINNTDWPVVTTRKLEAEVAVRTGETVVLGGLVLNSEGNQETKVPLLGDIPLLGIPFRSQRKEKSANEVIVFLTPYVLDSPEAIRDDAARRQGALNMDGMWQRGWSDSGLAEPTPEERAEAKKRRREEQRAAEEQEQQARRDAKRKARSEAAAPQPPAAPALELPEDMDPEVAEFIRRENRRRQRALEKLDKRVEPANP
jgi:type II secretory pathway component GspD/PulD (secretin)